MFKTQGFRDMKRSASIRQGVSAVTIEEFTHALECSAAKMRGFMLLRGGEVIAEKFWKPYEGEDRVWVYSISKSFTATAIGIAIEEGRLGLDDKVVSFFPRQCPADGSANLRAMRIRDLLSMTTGHAEDTLIPTIFAPDGDWVKAFLALLVEYEPGTHFLYNTGATFLLSAILQKVTGVTLLDYLAPRLFEPLGFDNVEWDQNPLGMNTGGWGIMIRLEDLAKLGQLYLDKGVYQGRRIISQRWVELASSKQADNSHTQNQAPDWVQGYGFQFWCCQHGAFRADGAAGQYCIVLPEQDAVLAVMSEVLGMQEIMDIVWDILLPGFDRTTSPTEHLVNGKTYTIESGSGITSACFSFSEDAMEFTLTDKGGSYHIQAGRGDWLSGETMLPLGFRSIIPMFAQALRPKKVSAHFCFTAEDTLEICWVYRDTPHRDKLICRFTEYQVDILCPQSEAAAYLGAGEVRLTGNA